MSVAELKALARRHWKEWLPEKVKELQAEGKLDEALQGAVLLAQAEIEHLMKKGYPEHAAREVALQQFILLKPEPPGEDDAQEQELREMEREYQRVYGRTMNRPDDDEDDPAVEQTSVPKKRPALRLATSASRTK